jgi:cell fate regulator YaaT (PSP1 superfamily)
MGCLRYGHDMYKGLRRRLPGEGGRGCHSGSGACGRVIELDPLRGTADLRTGDGVLESVPAENLTRPSDR